MSIFKAEISRYTASGKVNTLQNLKSQPMGHEKGGDSHMKQTGMLDGNFEFNP